MSARRDVSLTSSLSFPSTSVICSFLSLCFLIFQIGFYFHYKSCYFVFPCYYGTNYFKGGRLVQIEGSHTHIDASENLIWFISTMPNYFLYGTVLVFIFMWDQPKYLTQTKCKSIKNFSATAMDEGKLQKLGITHVLNAAFGTTFYHVKTGPGYYRESGFIFHGIPAMDMFTFKLIQYFDEACDFIGKAIGTKETGKKNGKIFVHCKEGVSRSVSLVLAYLVRDQDMELKDAVRLVRSKREILPNEGFLQQLIEYSVKLGKAQKKCTMTY